MHAIRRQRLLLVLFVVVFSSAAVGLIAYGLSGNINLFYTPMAVAAGEAPVDKNIRVGGMVVEGSVRRSTDSLRVEFAVTDHQATVPVVFEGMLPDLFDEGQGAVASGRLGADGTFVATEILAKHDENYMPPEVAAALEAAKAAGLRAEGAP
jgi:cytochrome c-type biogenesis protein CcmE